MWPLGNEPQTPQSRGWAGSCSAFGYGSTLDLCESSYSVSLSLAWARQTPGLPLWGWLIEALIKVLPIEITAWDRFSIKQRHFVHDPITTPERVGGPTMQPT